MRCPNCGATNAENAAQCATCRQDLSELNLTAARTTDISAPQVVRKSPPSGSQPSSSRSIAAGQDLGDRYRIVRQLGEGGMGEVFLARDRELDRDVALKLIRVDLASNPAILERFKREIQLSSSVTHKNILRVYDLGEAAGVKFLTMQYVQGQDLSALMRREGPLALPRVVEIFRQICEGLLAAHEQGIIHRDLKPQNIMIDEKGRVAIADFGLAKSLDYGTLTEAGKVIGTPHYMSPEQVKGIELDLRSDIYSLGIILYEMLTGTVPFTGSSAYEVMIQRTQRTPRPASDHNPKIPSYLLKILDRCLQTDPKMRYASTADVLRDLDAKTFHSTFGYRVRHQKKSATVAAALALVALIGGGIAAWKSISSQETATDATHKPVSVLVADVDNHTGDAVFDGTLEPVLTLALEGASFINSYSRAAAHKAATQIQPNSTSLDERLARLVAVREGVDVVVSGSVSRGDSYDLKLRAVDGATGKTVAESQVTAKTKDQVLAAVGRAAAELRQSLGDTTPVSAQLAAAETFTAGSLEAAHEYAIARDLFWRGKFEEAASHYERTIQLDPEMGRAYATLATIYANLGRKDDAEREYKLALSHSDRMTDREKYRTRISYYLLTHDNGHAIEQLNQLLKEYPVDENGLNNLPFAYFNARDMHRAFEESQRAIDVYPKNYIARNNAALYAMYAGDFTTAIKLAQAVLTMNPSYQKAYVAIALSQLAQGDVSTSTETYKRLAALSATGQSRATAGLADIALYQGATADATALLTQGSADDLSAKRAADASRKLATLALISGDGESAARVVSADTRDQHVLFTAARALIGAGRYDAALSVASRLGAQLEAEQQHYGKLIEGEVLLAKKQPREAIAKFEEAKRLADSWLVHFDRGRAYLDAAAFPEGDADFEACLRRRGEATAVFLDDVPTFHYFPAVYYYAGRTREGLGSKSAPDMYKQYLAIKTKDDGDPLVADARRRLNSASQLSSASRTQP